MKRIPIFDQATADALYRIARRDSLGQGTPAPVRPQYLPPHVANEADPIIVLNDSGEEVPPYACMKVTDASEENGLYTATITKPDSTGGPFLFNGHAAIPVGELGSAQGGPVVRAYYTAGTPAAGQAWGPSSTWTISATGTDKAVIVFGDVDTDILIGITDNNGACPSGLTKGVHKGTAGETITAGGSGNIIVDGTTIASVINQSECPVYIGDRVFVGVNDACETFFTPCKCCDGTDPDCCDINVAVCVGGVEVIIPVDGGTHEFDVSDYCCNCTSATLTVTLACSGGAITGTWDWDCDMSTDSGTLSAFDLDSLCDFENDVDITDTISTAECDIEVRFSNYTMTCTEPDDCPPSGCAGECLYIGQLNAADCDMVSNIYAQDITLSKAITCDGETLTVSVTVKNDSGGLWTGSSGFGTQFYICIYSPSDGTPSCLDISYNTSSPTYDNTGPSVGTQTFLSHAWDFSLADGATTTFTITYDMGSSCSCSDLAIEASVEQGCRRHRDLSCFDCG